MSVFPFSVLYAFMLLCNFFSYQQCAILLLKEIKMLYMSSV